MFTRLVREISKDLPLNGYKQGKMWLHFSKVGEIMKTKQTSNGLILNGNRPNEYYFRGSSLNRRTALNCDFDTST